MPTDRIDSAQKGFQHSPFSIYSLKKSSTMIVMAALLTFGSSSSHGLPITQLLCRLNILH